MSKRGLSIIIATVIIILITLISIGILWYVFRGVIEEKSDIAVEPFLVDIDIDPLSVMLLSSDYGNTNISLKIKRNTGEGNIDALKFIIYDGTYTHEEIINTTLEELTERTYFVPIGFLNSNSLQTITVIPILLGKEGEKKLARFGEELNFITNRTRTVNTGGGSSGGSGGGGRTPTCTPTKTCALNYIGQCGTQLSDGCNNVLNCANNCDATQFYCYKGEGDVSRVCINNSVTCSPQGNSCVNATALAQFYCYYNGTSFKFKNITSACVNGCEGNQCLGPCDLTSASWNVTTAIEGEMVKLTVQGSNCAGKNLNYTIYRNILWWFDTKIMTTSSQGSTTWFAGLKSDGTYELGNYYFIATLANNASEIITSSDPKLNVIAAPPAPVCGDGIIQIPETCDDNNIANSDGCSYLCSVETGWTCTGEPSICTRNSISTLSLQNFIDACQYLNDGDIPEDTFTPTTNAVYVSNSGSDTNSGTIALPFANLSKAITYANNNPTIPLTIYLKQGVYYFKHTNYAGSGELEYQQINRGNLYVTSYPGESATIRPYSWPNSAQSWGAEKAFVVIGNYENITFDNLNFEGWLINFYLGSNLTTPAMKNVVIKNIVAKEFKSRFGGTNATSVLTTDIVPDNVYGVGKAIFENPSSAKYQIEGLILSNITANDVSNGVNIGDENDANVKGLRISKFSIENSDMSGDTSNDAFAIVNSYKILVDNIHIKNIAGDGIDSKSFDICVVNSYLEKISRNAVKFWRRGE
ncbi:MAG: myxococcus cysteine-rich repeat containing protein, partial [Candidatus Pacearchaeota archaeon]